jgi:tetratricopeptide (TPR) repeat protein
MRHPSFIIPALVLLPVLALLLVAEPSLAQQPRSASSKAEADSRTYERCLALSRTDPAAAFEMGSNWRDDNGSSPAKHCVAMALIGLKQYLEAGIRLEKLALEMVRAPKDLRATVLAQAAQAWTLAGQYSKAEASLTAALRLDPTNTDLLTDRSAALASQKKYWEAVDDLNQVIEHDRRRTEAFLFRAAAYRYLEVLDLASEDVDQAIALEPKRPEGYLERGNIRRMKGDANGARRDWLQVLSLTPEGPAADDARGNLERLDVKVEAFTPGKSK